MSRHQVPGLRGLFIGENKCLNRVSRVPLATGMHRRAARTPKSVGLAYVLWFLLGLAGVHRIYLGRVGSGVGMLILTLLTICFGYIIFIGWFLALPLGLAVFVWWIVDAFLIPGIAPRSQS